MALRMSFQVIHGHNLLTGAPTMTGIVHMDNGLALIGEVTEKSVTDLAHRKPKGMVRDIIYGYRGSEVEDSILEAIQEVDTIIIGEEQFDMTPTMKDNILDAWRENI